MAIRNIVKHGDPILEKKARPVEKFDDKLAQLIDDMKETVARANGAGLAAQQVGILRRVAVVDIGNGTTELVNPEIIEEEGEQREIEGCLSFPDEWAVTKRPMRVVVKAQDRNGNYFTVKGEGLMAKALCHEIDHLEGILFLSKAIRKVSQEEKEKSDKKSK